MPKIYQTAKNKQTNKKIFHKLFQKTEEEGTLLCSFIKPVLP
jgi:hypothetical protein